MIEFLTLFLSLLTNTWTVELTADHRVAAIEIFLDGESAGRLDAPPWKLEVDFGQALEPHELVAVSYDEVGHRLMETRQWINSGRSLAEARVGLEAAEAGDPPRKARVTWKVFDRSEPRQIRARFNGKKIAVSPSGEIELPEYNLDHPQSLSVELRFEHSLEARAELSFGGIFGDSTSSELTAVPLRLAPEMETPKPAAMAGWFRKGEAELRVFSVAREAPAVLIVRDYNLKTPLKVGAKDQLSYRKTRDAKTRDAKTRNSSHGTTYYFVNTAPADEASRPERPPAIFGLSRIGKPHPSGLYQISRRLRPREFRTRPQRIFDAVAVAGKAAAATQRPRGVLLLLEPSSEDFSQSSFSQAAEYLKIMGVPFAVWLAGEGWEALAREADPLVTSNLGEATRHLEDTVQAQIIAWVEGGHLLHQLALSEAAPEGLRIAP